MDFSARRYMRGRIAVHKNISSSSNTSYLPYLLLSSLVTAGVIVSIVISVSFGSSVTKVTLPPKTASSTYGATVSFNWTFNQDLLDNSSSTFKNTSEKACQQISSIFSNYLPGSYSSCSVLAFSEGSVKTTFRFLFNFNNSASSNDENSLLIYKAIKDGARNKIANNNINPDSITVNAQWNSSLENVCEQKKPCDQICIPDDKSSAKYRCACIQGYKLADNTHCQADDACASRPCLNFGNCLPSGVNDYTCNCPLPYTSKDCSQVINNCDSQPCANGGQCVSGFMSFKCCCPVGYTGVTCQQQQALDVKKTNVTHYGASVSFTNLTFTSALLDSNSDIFLKTANLTCNQMALIFIKYLSNGFTSCTVTNFSAGSVVATFRFIFNFDNQQSSNIDNSILLRNVIITGIRTKTTSVAMDANSIIINADWNPLVINICELQKPCDQICDPNVTSSLQYTCACSTGYRLINGVHCEAEDACASSPCLNMGQCRKTPNNDYTCVCPLPYTAKDCSQLVDSCVSQPCLNKGVCINDALTSSFKCCCPAGYAGVICELTTAQCNNATCLNNGTCVNLITGGVTCLCPEGFAGTFCQNVTTSCRNSTCHNGGTCFDLYNGNYACKCPAGFAGTTCENVTTSCRNTTCANGGTCFDLVTGGSYCNCPQGFTGTTCTEDIDECSKWSPCQNGGICINNAGSFICNCSHCYSGMRCQTLKQLPATTTVQFSINPSGYYSFDSCCTPFSDVGLSLIKGPVQNVRIMRHTDVYLINILEIALQHGDSWSEYSSGSSILDANIVPQILSTTFPAGTYIKAINVFSDYALIGFNFTGSNDDVQCVGDCTASNLQTTIAPGGVLNFIDATITDELLGPSHVYGFANITFNFVCA